MALRIHRCEQIAGGCRLTILPDAPDAVDYLREQCASLGWQVGEPSPIKDTKMLSLVVRGPSDQELRSQLGPKPEFDFSLCS